MTGQVVLFIMLLELRCCTTNNKVVFLNLYRVAVKAGRTGPWTEPWTGRWTVFWTGFWTEIWTKFWTRNYRLFRLARRGVISLWSSYVFEQVEEEASAIVITSDDIWVALIKFLLQKNITDQNVNKVGAANARFVFSPQYIWKYDILWALL